MKLAVLSYPRSGSGLLYHIVKKHVECDGHLYEVFNSCADNLLLEGEWKERLIFEDQLEHKNRQLDQGDIQSRQYRLSLMEKYNHQDYFIRILRFDTTVPEINRYLLYNYRFITIERRNTFDSVLSGLIARKHWYFNYRGYPVPEYKPFAAEYVNFARIREFIKHYFDIKKNLFVNHIDASLIYEDIVDKSRGEVLEMAGFPGIVDNEEFPLKKLLNFDEKCELIENVDQVYQWCQEELSFFLPEDRQIEK